MIFSSTLPNGRVMEVFIEEATGYTRKLTPMECQARFMDMMGVHRPINGLEFRKDGVELAKSLIEEEVLKELMPALEKLSNAASLENFIEVADACVDSVYVILQLSNTLGIPFDRCFEEIHASNLEKRHPDGSVRKREDGKVLKPEGWKPPDLYSILAPLFNKDRNQK